MKLEDIKAPKGFVIRGYETPKLGDYILCPDYTYEILSCEELVASNHFCIVLDKVWAPEIGKYYQFSDDEDFCEDHSEIKKLSEISKVDMQVYKYIDRDNISWRYIRPVPGEFVK